MFERWLPRIGFVVRVGAAAVWLVAGAAKAVDLAHFHDQVDQYKLLPGSLEAPFAYALPFVEIFVGIYLLLGLLTRLAAIAGTVLLVLFIAAQAQAWARGLVLDCGCFGTLSEDKVGFWTITRDIGLGIPSILLVFFPARYLSLDQWLLGLPDRFRLQTPSPVSN